MRKRIVVLSLATALLLSSCGGSSSSTAASSVASESVASSVAESEPASEAIVEEVVEEEPEPREGNFRVGFWGDDIETVKKYETAELVEDYPTSLTYETTVSRYPAYAIYLFDDNGRMYMTGYKLIVEHRQGLDYITDYNALKDTLTSIYGEPDSDEIGNISHLANYTDAGNAIELGYTRYVARWYTDETEITLMLYNDDEIQIWIMYADLNHDKVYDTTGL